MRTGRDTGATAVEYGLVVAAISLLIAAVVFTLGGNLGSVFNEMADWLDAL